MVSASEDYRHMAEALRLAALGLYTTRPNPRVGCVLVKDGAVVGRGFHHHAGGPHAEAVALAEAGVAAAGACAYVTLEPCSHHGRTPPCADALVAAGVRRVVYATPDPHPLVDGGGARRLAQAGIETEVGVQADAAARLNRGFFSRFARGRPFVRLKTAMSLDGRIALASGESRWITGDAARADVQRLRAMSCAVLTGIGTVLSDNPALTVRDPRFAVAGREPRRIVLDSTLRTPAGSRIFAAAGEVWVFGRHAALGRGAGLAQVASRVELIAGAGPGVDLHALLRRLAELEINEILVEAGPTLAGAFLDAGAVDELVIYIAPRLLGASARGAFALAAPQSLAAAHGLVIESVTAVGRDWKVVAAPA